MATKPTRAAHKPRDRSPVPDQHLMDDFGLSHSVTTMTGAGPQSSIDLKNAGLGTRQPGTGNAAHGKTGRRIT